MIVGLTLLCCAPFFDAKVDEIKSIFSSGPQVDTATLKESLNRMAPTRRNAWGEIN